MQPYRQRKPRASPLWQCLTRHFHAFLATYEALFQSRYGFLRPIIPEVVNKFMNCGDLAHGFARVRCDHCAHEYLLAFSCKGRWFCPSCHQKKVQLFGALLTETILFPVPHRHLTFGIPKMLRPYFRFDRTLLKEFCSLAQWGNRPNRRPASPVRLTRARASTFPSTSRAESRPRSGANSSRKFGRPTRSSALGARRR